MRFILASLVFVNLLHAAPPDESSLKTPDSFPRFPAVEPTHAVSTFQVQDGFQMQLIAAEPLVTDPVAMVIDEQGRALVVEMNDYPYTDAKTHLAWKDNTTDEPIGKVRLLEDTDGDGVYDRSEIFAEGLSWPSGIACYRGGVLVTATPDIWYLKDTDGDRKADVREKVFTGFRKYNVQAVMNNPIWGLDNKLYVAGSSNGGSVLRPGQSESKPIVARGDFRIDPDTHEFELQAGGARFGNAFDDWGNRFLCNIRNPAIHVVLDSSYTARNPFFAAPALTHNIAEAGDQMPVYRISPVEPWRELRGRQWSADPTKKVPRSELTGGGVFTSTSGISVYRGHAYPDKYHGQLFVAEVANNVIYRQTMKSAGNTFLAERADDKVEFVASTDTWFRPVNLYNAPDGTLYVLDMYREVIEHPWSIPDDIHARLDLTSGRERGRIYRLAPRDFKPSPPPNLANLNGDELIAYLVDDNSWYRETAQRLIVEKQFVSVAPKLRELVKSSSPLVSIHALWTLHGLEKLTCQDVVHGLASSSARVREHSIKLSEPYLGKYPQLVEMLSKLSSDSDSRVRLQLALTLGGIDHPKAGQVLAELAQQDAGDAWMRVALCSAIPKVCDELLKNLLKSPTNGSSGILTLVTQLTQIVASQPEALVLSNYISASAVQQSTQASSDAVWNGLFAVAKKRSFTLQDYLKDEANKFASFEHDKQLAEDPKLDITTRQAAIARLTLVSDQQAIPALINLTEPLNDQVVVSSAIQAIGLYHTPLVAETLIERFRQFSPTAREEALTVLLARSERTLSLLDAIAAERFPVSSLGLIRKNQLLANSHPKIAQRIAAVLGHADAARAPVVARYVAETPLQGDSTAGQRLFMQHCASCHRTTGLGVEIGPHMETVKTWDREKLILNILDPNRELAPQAMAYSIALTSGSVINGMITDETSNSLTVRRPNAQDESILRDDIQQMTNTGISLMPVGLEQSITPQQMADLLAFLKQ